MLVEVADSCFDRGLHVLHVCSLTKRFDNQNNNLATYNTQTVVSVLYKAREFVAMQQAVAYYRVSTARQGRSGLGIEAQKEAIARFTQAEGFERIGEFIEVETGK